MTKTDEILKYWDLGSNGKGELLAGGSSCIQLANDYGTPLHVVHEERLSNTCISFLENIWKYPGKTSVHFAFKCNPVPGIIRIIRSTSIKAEVMSEFELNLALDLGYQGNDIVVNGPFKTDSLIRSCLANGIRLINVDSVSELERIISISKSLGKNADVLLRINPDFIPSGMNRGSAAADRKRSPFGLDLKNGEVRLALGIIKRSGEIRFRGFHLHIGSGIRNVSEFGKAILKIRPAINEAERSGFETEMLDVGGGLGVPDSREMTSFELLKYQAIDQLPRSDGSKLHISFGEYADSVINAVSFIFRNRNLPELIFEPGRCIASPNQLLLLRIHQVKERHNARKWWITDAGIGTLTMPTFYEHHRVILCNDVRRRVSEKVTISGPGCFSADVVYRNIPMPPAKAGELIAILDSGAYFTSWESSFGFPRPAIVSVLNGRPRLLRRRETFNDMVSRDLI
jgi:diaminopimelate decarboxylase